MTILSAPIHSRRPSTSAAHWAWEYGGMPSLCPQPRASKTTTRNRSDSGPKVALGFGQRADPSAAVVGDQHRAVLGAYHLDVQLAAVDGHFHAHASVDGDGPALDLVVEHGEGTAPLRSTASWNRRRSNCGPSVCCARSRRRTISRLPMT